MGKTWLLVLVLLAAAGCSSGPRDGEPTQPGATAPVDRAGAPPITAPRDLTSRATDPCRTLLTAAQVRELGYELPGRFRIDAIGSPSCVWGEKDARQVDIAVVLTRDGDFFVDTYRNRFLPVFRPLEIAGLPAVDIMTGPRAPVCTTRVGIADSQSLDLNTSVGTGIDGRPDGDPCAEGHRVAEEIVSTLPPQ